MALLSIQNLHVSVGEQSILKGVNLEQEAGTVHVMMGLNGSGKTTLAHVLAGQSGYNITAGNIQYANQDLLTLSPEERAQAGLFLSFQYPVEIPGISTVYFLKTAFNSIRKARNESELDAVDFLDYVKDKLQLVGLEPSFLYRSMNEGFSGGEKKRNEILQMAVLEPTLAILDETDSGLDIDSLKTIANSISQLRDPKRAILIITHYQRLLNYIQPDAVHILHQGIIARSGGMELANQLETYGYDHVLSE